MVRQYRYVFGENHRCEMATGGWKAGETLEKATQRELAEEVGYRAGSLQHISTFWTSKSVCQELAHLYIGRDLTAIDPAAIVPDETEFLEVALMPFAAVHDMVLSSEIRDGMTVIAVLWEAAQLAAQKR